MTSGARCFHLARSRRRRAAARSAGTTTAALAALLLLMAPAARAAEPEPAEPAGRVHLAASADREVPNDEAVVTLEMSAEGGDPTEVSREVSRRIEAALARARQEPDVTLRTGAVRTHPVYHEAKLRRWRATQQIVLETQRLGALPEILGALEEHVPISSVDFRLSAETRREAEDALLGEALGRYRARAARVAEGLGATGYRIHEIFVDANGAGPPQPLYARDLAAAEMRAASVPLEPGRGRVTVTVRGSVQLELP